MKVDQKRVSIGMPVHNGGAFIADALRSLMAQTFTDFQLTISDNASTDNTAELIREVCGDDPRITYVRQPKNIGAVANFQYVLDTSPPSEFFMWAAYDDRWDPRLLASELENIGDAALYAPASKLVYLASGRSENTPLPKLSTEQDIETNVDNFLANPAPQMIYGLHRRSVLATAARSTADVKDLWDVATLFAILTQAGITTAANGPKYSAGVVGERYIVKGQGDGGFASYRGFLFSMLRSSLQSSGLSPLQKFSRTRKVWSWSLRYVAHHSQKYNHVARAHHRFFQVVRWRKHAARLTGRTR